MLLKEVSIFLVFLFSLTKTHACDAKVVVIGREELAEEIKTQIAAALPKSEECATNENVTDIVRKETDKLFSKVEKLIKPTAEKLALLEQPGHFPSHPASSCKEILEIKPSSPSGYYWLRASNGAAVRMFCDMTRTCGGVTGGWMKVAELDMTNTTYQCPSSLRVQVQSGKHLCARKVTASGCSSVDYQTQGISYNEVCGKVIGYQYASTDGATGRTTIDGPYIDGVSLTHGSPRQHVWTFISALTENTAVNTRSTCYCANRNQRGPTPPSFVGQDYFCDTGSRRWIDGDRTASYHFYNSPLWDGAGCGPTNECCSFQNPPMFYKNIPQGTRDNIEMRVCRDEVSTNEDVLIESVDIYVR